MHVMMHGIKLQRLRSAMSRAAIGEDMGIAMMMSTHAAALPGVSAHLFTNKSCLLRSVLANLKADVFEKTDGLSRRHKAGHGIRKIQA